MIDRPENPIEYDTYSFQSAIGATTCSLANIMKGDFTKKRRKGSRTLLKKQTTKRQATGLPSSLHNQSLRRFLHMFFFLLLSFIRNFFRHSLINLTISVDCPISIPSRITIDYTFCGLISTFIFVYPVDIILSNIVLYIFHFLFFFNYPHD